VRRNVNKPTWGATTLAEYSKAHAVIREARRCATPLENDVGCA
jgi:hypothetical protein